MPPKPNLVLPNIDDYATKSIDKSNDVKACDTKPETVRRESSAPIIEDWELDSDEENEPKVKVVRKTIESKTIEKDDVSKNVKPGYAKIEFIRPKSARQVIQDTNSQSRKPRGNQRNYNNMVSQRLGNESGQVLVNTAKQNLSKEAILVNTARPINTASSRPKVKAAKQMPNTFKKAHLHVERPFKKLTAKKNNNYKQRVNIVKGTGVNIVRLRQTVNTARPKATVNAARSRVAVKTARPKAVLKAVWGNIGNAVKALAYYIWRPKQKVIDHVSKNNIASITYKEFNYVDAQGRLIKDILPLEATPKERKSKDRIRVQTSIMRVSTVSAVSEELVLSGKYYCCQAKVSVVGLTYYCHSISAVSKRYGEPINLVIYEAVYEEMYDSVERAATTATSLDAEQDSSNITKTQFTTIPNDPFS
ncbi:hypothetical protein Tco_0330991 [Tanacetum coccineum]